jgi:hypothetical protein
MGEIFRGLRDQIAAQDTHVNRDEFILNDLANLLRLFSGSGVLSGRGGGRAGKVPAW